MSCPKIVPKGDLSEMMSNWQTSIGYEDNQIITVVCVHALTHTTWSNCSMYPHWCSDAPEHPQYPLGMCQELNLGGVAPSKDQWKDWGLG